MIEFACHACSRSLEVDDELAAKRAACPFCEAINEVPSPRRVNADGVPFARAIDRPSVTPAPKSIPAVPTDRATAMGLPPDSGPEQNVLSVRPVMLRANLLGAGLLFALVLVSVLAAIVGAFGLGSGTFAKPDRILMFTGLGGLGLSAAWWCVWRIRKLSTRLIITNKRTIARRGFLSKSTREVLHDKVQDIQVRQSFFERLLGVGSLGVSSAGESGVEIEIEGLPNPQYLRAVIDAYREIG